MSGFPGRPNRAIYGPTFEEETPVKNPKRELSAAQVNLLAWQQAGLGLCSPRGFIKCSVSGSAVTNEAQAFAWDPDGAMSTLSIGYTSTGVYTFALLQQYADELGVATNIDLLFAQAFAIDMTVVAVGVVELTSGYEGTIRFLDHSNSPIEADDFALLLW